MDEEEFNTFYEPKMDRTISNVGIRCSGALNMFALQLFIGEYLEDEEIAKDFLRVKGVFNIAGTSNMYVMQCVHMIRSESFTRPWGEDEVRENRIIFIGRRMQERRQELTKGFMECVAKPLRFSVGAPVLAHWQDDFVKATIIKQWDECRAYRVHIHDRKGTNVWALIDDDRFVTPNSYIVDKTRRSRRKAVGIALGFLIFFVFRKTCVLCDEFSTPH